MNRSLIIIFIFHIITLGRLWSETERTPTYIGWPISKYPTLLVAADVLNLREKPDRNSNAIQKLTFGETVNYRGDRDPTLSPIIDIIDDKKNAWLYISTPSGVEGWVFGEYIAVLHAQFGTTLVYVKHEWIPVVMPEELPSQENPYYYNFGQFSKVLYIKDSSGATRQLPLSGPLGKTDISPTPKFLSPHQISPFDYFVISVSEYSSPNLPLIPVHACQGS